MATAIAPVNPTPLSADMEEWDEFLKGRYREGKSEEEFRQYDAQANPGVANFYKLNHENQTFDYVIQKEKQYFGLDKGEKSIWEAAEFLNTLVDDSDPDTDLTQIEHLLQTSEAIRRGRPSALVCAHRVCPRSGQSAMPVGRAAMGRRGRHVSSWLRLFGAHRFPGVLRSESRPASSCVLDEVWHLRAELRPR